MSAAPSAQGGGGGEGDDAEEEEEEPLLNKMADQWMSIRELKKVCLLYICTCDYNTYSKMIRLRYIHTCL